MAKSQVSFVCQECGYDSPQWLGKCPECGNWNSFKEFRQAGSKRPHPGPLLRGEGIQTVEATRPQPLREVSLTPKERILTGYTEMDNVLGGGIVPGSVTLLAGDPGIGKSTLLLQLCLNLSSSQDDRGPVGGFPPAGARSGASRNDLRASGSPSSSATPSQTQLPKTVLYISGEESKNQVAMRASRLLGDKFEILNSKSEVSSDDRNSNDPSTSSGKNAIPESSSGQALKQVQDDTDNLLLLSLTNVDQIIQVIEETKPDFVVIDSIQTIDSEEAGGLAGSVSQIRYATNALIKVAKQNNIPMILVGHVTKEGMVAGPMILSHMVDTVLFLEGEKLTKTRILRSLKNRFGPVDEVGVFLMQGQGMVEVKNPEQIFLSTSQQNTPGSVLVVIMEGTRPFLIEIQSLVVYSKFPMPRRVASGIDNRRLELLLAVLQKHAKLPLETYDVFVNIAGGIRVQDPAVDLGVCLAVYSSLKNRALGKTVGIAEVGLLGELRKVPELAKRIKEAKKLGFDTVITADIFKSISEVLTSFGFPTRDEKRLKEIDPRHLRFEREEE